MFLLVRCLIFVILTTALSLPIIWYLLSYESILNLVAIEDVSGQSFDYIIVGAGTAGSVLAYRLTERNNQSVSVLLIEAGNHYGPVSIIPLLSPALQLSSVDWAQQSQSQKYSSRGLKKNIQFLPRGKGLGGSSQINYMLHFEGMKKDYERWVELGATDWSYGHLSKFMVRNRTLGQFGRECKRNKPSISKDGKITSGRYSHSDDVCFKSDQMRRNDRKLVVRRLTKRDSKFLSILSNSVKDYNKNRSKINQVKFKVAEYNTKNGIRWSVYQSYLRPSFNNTKLKILINTRVKKILFDNEKRATSVLISTENGSKKSYIVHASKEIILSAGSFHTPQLLLLSGIGDENYLKNYKINGIHHSPMVGKNLYDHLNMPLFVSINESISLTKDKVLNLSQILQYLLTGQGLFSFFNVIGFVNVPFDNHGIAIFGTGAVDEDALKAVANFRDEIFRSLFPFHSNGSQEGFVLLSTCHHPKSHGQVTLNHKDPFVLPAVDPNYLRDEYDVKCMIDAVRLAVRIIDTKPFRHINATIHWPKFEECINFGPSKIDYKTNHPSDRYLECIIRVAALTAHHPGGSCSIGHDSDSVVDNSLRVNGVKGLRIVDASVMPSPISGTPHSVIVLVAERAAELILNS